jgi:hypothetical protein
MQKVLMLEALIFVPEVPARIYQIPKIGIISIYTSFLKQTFQKHRSNSLHHDLGVKVFERCF